MISNGIFSLMYSPIPFLNPSSFLTVCRLKNLKIYISTNLNLERKIHDVQKLFVSMIMIKYLKMMRSSIDFLTSSMCTVEWFHPRMCFHMFIEITLSYKSFITAL